jgi:hypothetical protein
MSLSIIESETRKVNGGLANVNYFSVKREIITGLFYLRISQKRAKTRIKYGEELLNINGSTN